ncbi:MAG: hypothetical protein ACRDGH_16515 [Candidatus Limnocylindria bacterium]
MAQARVGYGGELSTIDEQLVAKATIVDRYIAEYEEQQHRPKSGVLPGVGERMMTVMQRWRTDRRRERVG